ncbi:MAG TPA: acyl-CoA dehydrogenase family protein, partial [Vicinamibacteria bacterium]|nr:acyl-CoA dehydrogenase family protein [Vicinamibacteria bacterium]
MDFEFSEEQLEMRRTLRDFAEKEILPHAAEWDEKKIFPRKTIAALGELGFLGVIFPSRYGGAGLSYVDYALVIEELARADASVAITLSAHISLCSNHIYEQGTEEQKEEFLTPLASGKWIGAWSLTEPEAGSDAGGTRTTAVLDGDEWVLNGSKTFTTNGSVADVAIAIAVTDKSKGSHGISAFIVPRGTPGFRNGKKEDKLGHRASDTSEMVFDNCRVPKRLLLGDEGEGFVSALKILDGGRIGIAALGLGIAQASYECARQYSQQRKQFGKSISSFQAIQWKLADMATEIDAARLLMYRAAWLKDRGKPHTKEAAMAKLYA